MHQRSKCYIKSSYYEREEKEKLAYLDKAYRDANTASDIFSRRYDNSGSGKLLISIDHVTYTQALILCHKCNISEYKDIDTNTLAVETLNRALSSPHNSYSFAKSDTFNYNNVIRKIVSTAMADKNLVYSYVYEALDNLFHIISEDTSSQ